MLTATAARLAAEASIPLSWHMQQITPLYFPFPSRLFLPTCSFNFPFILLQLGHGESLSFPSGSVQSPAAKNVKFWLLMILVAFY